MASKKSLKGYRVLVTCTGSILLGLEREASGLPIWRARSPDGNNTLCTICLLKKNWLNYVIQSYDSGTARHVYIDVSLKQVKLYHVITASWHEVELKDGRQFVIHLDDNQNEFLTVLQKVIKREHILVENSEDGEAMFLATKQGNLITEEEIFRRMNAHPSGGLPGSGGLPYSGGLPGSGELPGSKVESGEDETRPPSFIIKRGAQPLPAEDEELANLYDTATGDSENIGPRVIHKVRSFTFPFDYGRPSTSDQSQDLLDQLSDEGMMLERAILCGDIDGAKHWAGLLAKEKRALCVLLADDMRDCRSPFGNAPVRYDRIMQFKKLGDFERNQEIKGESYVEAVSVNKLYSAPSRDHQLNAQKGGDNWGQQEKDTKGRGHAYPAVKYILGPSDNLKDKPVVEKDVLGLSEQPPDPGSGMVTTLSEASASESSTTGSDDVADLSVLYTPMGTSRQVSGAVDAMTSLKLQDRQPNTLTSCPSNEDSCRSSEV